jgi:adenosylmethionine-8-amino-7-oxononanoate aminotransferase
MSCSSQTAQAHSEYFFDRNLRQGYPVVKSANGNILTTKDNREIFDACTGAAVACLGYNNKDVIKAIDKQQNTGVAYLASHFWANDTVEELCKELIRGTDGKMGRVYLTGSGSEAMEAAIKLSRQFFYEQNEKNRVNFIARRRSYHGNTMGALSVSEFNARKEPYAPFLMGNVHHVSPCYSYRGKNENETDEEYVSRLADELDKEFKSLGPETVIGFIAEPVVGAALGCVPFVPGYLKAMREVCHKYRALFILDEVMCGMGRTGTLHAWQAEDVMPDIQTMAKGLGGGYQPIGAMMISPKVVEVILRGSGEFTHGQTYQGMPVQAAAALEVQRIIREKDLLKNVCAQGELLEKLLKGMLGNHPNVGDIRGRGLFWGLEFVKDKATKEPFERERGVANGIMLMAMSSPFNITVYAGTGSAEPKDGTCPGLGDHILLAPAYTVKKEDIELIAGKVSSVIKKFFEELEG